MSGKRREERRRGDAADEAKSEPLAWHSPKAAAVPAGGAGVVCGGGRLSPACRCGRSGRLPAAVDALANHTAGAQIGFRSDSARVSVRVKLAGPADMDHMPATGQCGFDCYVRPDRGDSASISGRRDTTTGRPPTNARCSTMRAPALRNFTLNFPLYQGVEEVSVGLDAGAQVLPPPPFALDRPVVAYGTSITQGGCASRPGMAWTNILSRRLNVEFINLGFSGSGRGEPEVAATIAEIPNPACFILDYEANAGWTER